MPPSRTDWRSEPVAPWSERVAPESRTRDRGRLTRLGQTRPASASSAALGLCDRDRGVDPRAVAGRAHQLERPSDGLDAVAEADESRALLVRAADAVVRDDDVESLPAIGD